MATCNNSSTPPPFHAPVQPPCNNYYSAYCNPKDTPVASPRASSRPPACSPSLTKNLLPPPSSPLKKQRKARWIHTKARFLRGSETASARSKTGARQSLSPQIGKVTEAVNITNKGQSVWGSAFGDESHLYRYTEEFHQWFKNGLKAQKLLAQGCCKKEFCCCSNAIISSFFFFFRYKIIPSNLKLKLRNYKITKLRNYVFNFPLSLFGLHSQNKTNVSTNIK